MFPILSCMNTSSSEWPDESSFEACVRASVDSKGELWESIGPANEASVAVGGEYD